MGGRIAAQLAFVVRTRHDRARRAVDDDRADRNITVRGGGLRLGERLGHPSVGPSVDIGHRALGTGAACALSTISCASGARRNPAFTAAAADAFTLAT